MFCRIDRLNQTGDIDIDWFHDIKNRAFIERLSTKSALSTVHGVPDRPSHPQPLCISHLPKEHNRGAVITIRSVTLPYCPPLGTLFTHAWAEEMHVKSLSQDLASTWNSQGSKPGSSDPEAKCLPLDHNFQPILQSLKNFLYLICIDHCFLLSVSRIINTYNIERVKDVKIPHMLWPICTP